LSDFAAERANPETEHPRMISACPLPVVIRYLY
jgi:hypothetical protein